MHWAGLYSSRWGLQDSPPVPHPMAVEVVESVEQQWPADVRALWDGNGLRSAFEAALWQSYEVLQALDVVSLYLCVTDLDAPTDLQAQTVPVAATLRGIDQPDGARTVPFVPTTDEGHAELRLHVAPERRVVVDPFPFGGDVTVEIPTRRIADEQYADAAAAAAAYHAAPVVPERCVLVAAA
jgi:hypothetical protein